MCWIPVNWEQKIVDISNKLCIYPWNTLSIGSKGWQRVCCNYTTENTKDRIIRPDNIDNDELDLKNGPYLSEIREYMLKDKWHPTCRRCQAMEEKDVQSFRQEANNRFSKTYDQIFNEKKNKFLNVEYLQLDFSNKCNAACFMCGSHSSSLWAKHLNEFPEITTWSDHKINLILEDVDHIKEIHVFGGEPLIQPEFVYLCEKLVEVDVAKKIKLIFTTNASMLHKRDLLTLFKNFKEVQVCISLDGMDKLYDYIRWPLLWYNIKSNINIFLKETKNSNIRHSFSITLQIINIFNLVELFRNFDLIFDTVETDISLVEVYNPNHLALRYSSPEFIGACLQYVNKEKKLNNYLIDFTNRLKNEQKNITEPWKYKIELMAYINKMNKMRSIDLFDILPKDKLFQ